MTINIKNGKDLTSLNFDNLGEYDTFYQQILEALEDENNTQVVMYETIHSTKIFPANYLKNSIIEAFSGNVEFEIESETN